MYSALVVDDDPTLRRINKTHLARKGVKTKTVNNGQEAVDIIRSGESFNLVLMDLEMPIKNGIQATRELRAMEVKSVIVGITACASEDLVEEFANCGLDCCLQKPLNSEKVDTIMQLLNRDVNF